MQNFLILDNISNFLNVWSLHFCMRWASVCVCVCHEINVLALEHYLCLIACQMLALFIMQR